MPARLVMPTESFGERLRSKPLAVAGVAAAGGLLCGGLIVAALNGPSTTSSVLANRAQPIETTGSAPQEPKPAPRQVAKTSVSPQPQQQAKIDTSDSSRSMTTEASAPVEGDKTAAVDCQGQTWPYIARPCLANETKKRGVRVISTDKLAEPVIGAVEAPPPEVTNRFERTETARQLPPPPPMIGAPATTPAPSSSVAVTQNPPPKPDAAVAAKVEPTPAAPVKSPIMAAKPEPSKPAAAATASVDVAAPVSGSTNPALQPAFHTSAPPAPSAELASTERRQAAAERSYRQRNGTRQRALAAERALADDEEPVIETGRSPQLGDGARTHQVTIGERPRVVERWIEREYDVPSAGRPGSRSRVTVIQRGADGYQPAPRRVRSASDVYYAKHTQTGD